MLVFSIYDFKISSQGIKIDERIFQANIENTKLSTKVEIIIVTADLNEIFFSKNFSLKYEYT